METIQKIIRVDRREIGFLKFILEAYDGIATMTTLDALQGVVLLRIAPGCEKELEALLRDLSKDIMIEVIETCQNTMIGKYNRTL